MYEFELLKEFQNYIPTFEGSPMPTILCDSDFNYYWSNSLAKRSLSIVSVQSQIKNRLKEYDIEHIQSVIEQTGSITIGEFIPFSGTNLTITPLKNGTRLLGYALLFLDFSNYKTDNEMLSHAPSVSILNNVIRKNITSIFARMDVLEMKEKQVNAGWILPHLSMISQDSYAVLRTLENATMYTKLEIQDYTYKKEVIDLEDWFNCIETTVISLGQTANIPIHFYWDSVLSPVFVDMKLFQLAFFNILNNALYFTKENNEVRVSSKSSDQGVEIQFTDRGLGIPEEVLSTVFNPYYSYYHNLPEPHLGLGLTLAKLIIESFGGNISLQSQYGEGTTVKVFLPYPPPNQEVTFGQTDFFSDLLDRFSPLYIGLSGISQSPFTKK